VRALERGVCTWDGARHYVEQHWYHCKTCYTRDPLSGCCLVCKEVCHKDHDLVPRYGAFFWYVPPPHPFGLTRVDSPIRSLTAQ
jgi:hypothetical protein